MELPHSNPDEVPDMELITEAIKDAVQERLIALNAECETVGDALDEVCINYEVIAHLIAGLGSHTPARTQHTIIDYITRNLAAYVAELTPLPPHMAPGSTARN